MPAWWRRRSLARALFAFNSTNVEGWELYAPPKRRCSLNCHWRETNRSQFRLLRPARAFLDRDCSRRDQASLKPVAC